MLSKRSRSILFFNEFYDFSSVCLQVFLVTPAQCADLGLVGSGVRQGDLLTVLVSVFSLSRLCCVGALWGDSIGSFIFLAGTGRGGGGGGEAPRTGSSLALGESGPG